MRRSCSRPFLVSLATLGLSETRRRRLNSQYVNAFDSVTPIDRRLAAPLSRRNSFSSSLLGALYSFRNAFSV